MHIKAFEMMMKSKTLPCNVKFMIEGEEEVGSEPEIEEEQELAQNEYSAL